MDSCFNNLSTILGEEAIRIQDGSSNVLIEGNNIHTTGLFTPAHGEAVYVGSDKSVHSHLNIEAAISHVTVRDNVIGPNVTAEAIDIREGAHDVRTVYDHERWIEKGISNPFALRS